MMQVLPTEILDWINSNDFNLFFSITIMYTTKEQKKK